MQTTLIEVHIDGEQETKKHIEFDTKYEAERFAKIYNEFRYYDFVDRNGKQQKLYFYTVPKKYVKVNEE